jgi:hypothetical protein
MLKAPDELEVSKEKFRGKRVIFLARDPRDVIVSSYFEMNKRAALIGENPYESRSGSYEGSLEDFIQRKVGGFETILRYYNIWAGNRDIPKGFLLVRYEDLKANPLAELRRIVDFLGQNMRKMEEQGRFQGGVLNPGNQDDRESYKTRKGKIGGYADYLSPDQIALLNQRMADELSGYYGYTSSLDSRTRLCRAAPGSGFCRGRISRHGHRP